MPKNKVSEWSSTAANNTDIGSIDIAEGCAPSGINNAIREMMAQVKDMQAGTDADNFTVGGNLNVTGTTTATGAITATGGVVGNVTGNLTGNASTATTATSATSATTATTATKATNIAGGGAGQVPYNSGADATAFLAAGTSGQVLQSNGTSAPSWGTLNSLTSDTAQASTSGTSIDFTGIPSWAKKITVMFSGVRTNGSSATIIQLGDAGGFENTGYLGASLWGSSGAIASSAHTSGALISSGGADTLNAVRQGLIVFTLLGSNVWTYSGNFALTNVISNIFVAGSKSLSDVLTQVKITTVNGTDAFNAGLINIMYE